MPITKRQRSNSVSGGGSYKKKSKKNNNNYNNSFEEFPEKEKRRDKLAKEIVSLRQRIDAESPPSGYAPPLQQRVAFRALPLSEATMRGIEQAPFETMTAIQNACIPHALAGRDILGAAKTGSGKTLAFVIPVLETLYRNHFGDHSDTSPGAIILSPTRELATQIFQVLRQVGKHHSFSAGLLIGGKRDFYEEQIHVPKTNILIATPGRLLQHLEQTPMLEMSELQILVLDEADRILDMGFRDQLVRILDYLPTTIDNREGLFVQQQHDANTSNVQRTRRRQTLLFSATQTKSVSQLATLSLDRKNTEYLGVHDKERNSTPEGLQQSYVVVPLEHKLNAVYSFVKSHLTCKSIIFLASCSQVRYAWELFCSLRPGIVVMALHGKMTQEKRTKIYFDFIQKKKQNREGITTAAAVLFATDIAARGLDFPNVDWVVQMDAPEDRDMYIHRVGRTARYRAGGKSLLMITPQEEQHGLIQSLFPTPGNKQEQDEHEMDDDVKGKSKNNKGTIPIRKLSINPTKTVIVSQRASSLVASNPTLNTLAKKAFHSYIRSIALMPLREIFQKVLQEYQKSKEPLDAFSKSLGLASTPNLRFLKSSLYRDHQDDGDDKNNREDYRKTKNINKKLQKLKEQIKAEKLAKKLERLGGSRKPSDDRDGTESEEEEDEEGLLVYKGSYQGKQQTNDDDDEDDELEQLPNDVDIHKVSKSRQRKKIRIDGSSTSENKHIIFDDDSDNENDEEDSNPQDPTTLQDANDEYVAKVRERLQQNLEQDRSKEQLRIREKHRKKRFQEKDKKEENDDHVEQGAVLLQHSEDENDEDSVGENSSSSSSSSDDDNDDSSTSSSSPSEDGGDLKAQEDLALSLIGK